MAPHTINTTVADRQLGKRYFFNKSR